MIDITTAYILKTWGQFMLVLFPVSEVLVLLIDWVFQKWEEKKNAKNKSNGNL